MQKNAPAAPLGDALRTPHQNNQAVAQSNLALALTDTTRPSAWPPICTAEKAGLVEADRSPEGSNESHRMEPVVKVIIGRRQFANASWTRKDSIYLDGKLIGIIKLGEFNRPGTTICLANSAEMDAWRPTWCLDEHLRLEAERRVHERDH